MQNYQVLVLMLYLTNERKNICALVDANQMYTRCQSSTVSDSMQKLKETSESKKYFFEIKTVSRDDVLVKSAETRIL